MSWRVKDFFWSGCQVLKCYSPRVGEFPRGIPLSFKGEEGGEWWNAAKKRGQDCKNSCLLLRNRECFPANWINKHILYPLGHIVSLARVGSVQKRHQQCCLLDNMLLINSDETGNNRECDILGLLISTFVSKTVALISFSGK